MNLRNQIKMTQEEIDSFLKEQTSIQIGTINKDGSPHLTTLWFQFDGSNIIFHTYTKSQKIKNLKRDNRISLISEFGTEYRNLKGVMIYGKAEIISGEDMHEKVTKGIESVSLKYNHISISKEYLESMKFQAKKRSVVIVKPKKYISWDHNKI